VQYSVPSTSTVYNQFNQPINFVGDTVTEMYSYTKPGQIAAKRLRVARQPSSGQALTADLNATWDYTSKNEGHLTGVTYPGDPNFSAVPSYTYTYDAMGRLNTMTDGNGGTVVSGAQYNAAGQMTVMGIESRSYNSMGQLTGIGYSGSLNMTYTYSATQNNGKIVSQTDNLGGEQVTYVYDSLKRLTSATAAGWNQSFVYDPFGNLTDKNGTNSWHGVPDATTNRLGSVDANGNALQSPAGAILGYDAENRLITAAGTTLYAYDAQNNLLRVDQKGSAPADSTQWRSRQFTYDRLGRLLTAANPESGTIFYAYDANGNLLQKTGPAANQAGTATQTTSFCYDGMNRITGKAYSAQTCQNGYLPQGLAAVSYVYDIGANAAKGHLTSWTDQAGSANYSYDVAGHISSEQRTLNGVPNPITKTAGYTYNPDDSLATLTYPSGAVVTYAPDSAGRFLSAVDVGHNTSYVTAAVYSAGGSIATFVSGSSSTFAGITNAFVYNDRLQLCRRTASSMGAVPTNCTNSSGNLLDLSYDLHSGNGDNGNVYGVTNNRDISRSQSFTYDALNRLATAQNAGTDCAQTVIGKTKFWGNSYSYDAWGNLLGKSVTKCSAENIVLAATSNNQLLGYGYDAAGNMTSDPTDGVTATYDAENRISAATRNSATITYTYDEGGNRVKKTSNGMGTLYWYMTPGIVGESDLSGNLKTEYIFFDGERVARRDYPGNTVSYYFSDHLKTASVVTDATGTVLDESDYYPWGGELQFVNNLDNHYKFTGKERDSETGLDYFGARYYSNGLGRFITPDWAAKATAVPYADFADPQSLNLYTYVRNIPTTNVDADGHLFFHWHFLITYAAGVRTGHGPFHGVFSSFGKAARNALVDFRKGAQEDDAAHTNMHAMRGRKPDGTTQSGEEAKAAIAQVVTNAMQNGDTALAGHDVIDAATPGHQGEIWPGVHLGMKFFKHLLGDIFPSPATVKQAYQNEKAVLQGTNPLVPTPKPTPAPPPPVEAPPPPPPRPPDRDHEQP